jgi:curved DNA-binding protein CbpA
MTESAKPVEDYYALLNLSPTASTEQIKNAFKSISIFHPDKMKNASHRFTSIEEKTHFDLHKASYHEEFLKLNRAYSVLMDPILRSIYDEFGFNGLEFAEQTILKQTKSTRHRYSSGNNEINNSETTEVGFHTPASIRIMQNIREAIQIKNQNELTARLLTHNSVQMDVNLEDIFDSSDAFQVTESISESISSLSSLLNSLDIPQLVIQTSVGGHVTPNDQCTLSSYVVTRDGLGFGDLQFNWHHIFQPSIMWMTANVAGPFSKMLACNFTRVVDQESDHQVSLGGSIRRGETGLSLSTTRKVGNNYTATIGWKIGREGGINFAVGHKNDENHSNTKYEVFASDLEMGGNAGIRVTHKKVLNDRTSTIRTGFKIGVGEVEIFGGHTRKLTKYSRLGASMNLSLTGVTVRIKYKRGETEFVVPFRLSKSIMGLESPWSIVAGGVLEGLVWMGMEWIMGPTKQKENELVKSVIGKRVRLARKSARNQQLMMVPRANEIITCENVSIHGLIIIEARYGTKLKRKYPWSSNSIDDVDENDFTINNERRGGNGNRTHRRRRRRHGDEGYNNGNGIFSDSDFDSDDFDSDDSDSDDDVVGGIQNRNSDGLFYPPNIDVRIPLQFLVDNGVLRISGDIKKSKMLGKNNNSKIFYIFFQEEFYLFFAFSSLSGFCDPSILEHPIEPATLYIKYSCGGQVYECSFSEQESVMLPSPNATELQGAEYLSFRPWFQPPSGLKGIKLEEWKREHPSYAYSERQIRIDRQRLALRLLRAERNGGETKEDVNGIGWVRHNSKEEEQESSNIVNLDIE